MARFARAFPAQSRQLTVPPPTGNASTGTLTLAGLATVPTTPATATGALNLTGTATFTAQPVFGMLTLGGAASAVVNVGGLTFDGTVAPPSARSSISGSLTFTGLGGAIWQPAAAAAGVLSFSGSDFTNHHLLVGTQRAAAVYVGAVQSSAVYAGTVRVWTP